MKKAIIALTLVFVLAVGLIGFFGARGEKGGSVSLAKPTAAPAAQSAETAGSTGTSESAETAGEAEAYTLRTPDYAAMYALHAPDEVVAVVDGKDVTWGEYFYLYFSQAKQIENYFSTMAAYYGAAPDWDSHVEDDSDETYADIVPESVESTLKQIHAIEGLAAKLNVELSDEQLEAIRTQEEEDIVGAVGEGATAEDFNAYIETIFLPRSLYDRMNRVNYLYRQGFVEAYGANGELVEDGTALQYLADNEYMAATHILLMTIDPATYEALSEETVEAKKTQAEQIAAELQAIEDDDQRLARFVELKAEYCEDSGKARYPDGYTFLPGKMVAGFEETVLSLEDYQVSDPLLSDYGYHVIMRLPLDPDAVIEYSNDGTALSARSKVANDAYGQDLQDYFDSLTVEYKEGFEAPDLMQYLQ